MASAQASSEQPAVAATETKEVVAAEDDSSADSAPAAKKRRREDGTVEETPVSAVDKQLIQSLCAGMNKEKLVSFLVEACGHWPGLAARLETESNADPAARKLFVRDLAWSVTSESLKEYFSQWGEVEEGGVVRDKNTNKSRGFGFITYAKTSSAVEALRESVKDIEGRPAKVNLAALGPQKPRHAGMGMGRSDGGGGGRGGHQQMAFRPPQQMMYAHPPPAAAPAYQQWQQPSPQQQPPPRVQQQHVYYGQQQQAQVDPYQQQPQQQQQQQPQVVAPAPQGYASYAQPAPQSYAQPAQQYYQPQ